MECVNCFVVLNSQLVLLIVSGFLWLFRYNNRYIRLFLIVAVRVDDFIVVVVSDAHKFGCVWLGLSVLMADTAAV